MEKILWIISVTALIFIIAIVTIYFKIYASNEWSDNINEWSGFGNFVGGTLSPLLAFSALIALIFSIQNQIKEFKKSNQLLIEQNNLIKNQTEEANNSRMREVELKKVDIVNKWILLADEARFELVAIKHN
ncbi:hypothetical protein [Nitrosomonas oligotropha]|uniref:hypothetical protein n=1 Tax=Nitrosomonas oligotropha TaxID=42354 RepID=UPI00136E78B0|nr:hypothetical protein [Nitrosomonas oligotropha]MXS83624.1 hypothetical protein [Nitrosomonas oligotropha]